MFLTEIYKKYDTKQFCHGLLNMVLAHHIVKKRIFQYINEDWLEMNISKWMFVKISTETEVPGISIIPRPVQLSVWVLGIPIIFMIHVA